MAGGGVRLWVPTVLALICLALAFEVNAKLAGEPGLWPEVRKIYRAWRPGPAVETGLVAAKLPPTRVAPLPATPTFVMDPLANYEEIVVRPLFSPTRRPPSEEVVAAAAEAPESPLKLVLRGVIVTGERRIALFETENGDDEKPRLTIGDSHEGWFLRAIEPDNVTFERDDEIRVLELAFDEPAPRQTRSRRDRRRLDRRLRRRPPVAGRLRRALDDDDDDMDDMDDDDDDDDDE